MKKRIVTLLSFIIVMACIFTACAYENENMRSVKEEYQVENETKIVYGDYFLFKTRSSEEYLKFLEDFDDTKYEIVDVSASLYYTESSFTEFYYVVTYKVKEIEAS